MLVPAKSTLRCALLLAITSQPVLAQLRIDELLTNPPGFDNGQEAIELVGPPSTQLAGWSLITIDGDQGVTGVIDVAMALDSYATGSNGLLLVRDAGLVLQPPPAPETAVVIFDWSPDLENGTLTVLVGIGPPPQLGIDLDLDDDGAVDAGALGAFMPTDGLSLVEDDNPNDRAYADDFGGPVFGPYDGSSGPAAHMPGAVARFAVDPSPCAFVGGAVLGASPGPYPLDAAADKVFGLQENGLAGYELSLGIPNAIPDADGDGVTNACDGCPADPTKAVPGICGCGVPEGCSLAIDVDAISVTVGGAQQLELLGGAGNAGHVFVLLGTLSGTSPGTPIGPVLLPLNVDAHLLFMLSNPNAIVMPSVGTLDLTGQASAVFTVPPGTMVSGLPITLHHAYVAIDLALPAVVFASNATPLTIVP